MEDTEITEDDIGTPCQDGKPTPAWCAKSSVPALRSASDSSLESRQAGTEV